MTLLGILVRTFEMLENVSEIPQVPVGKALLVDFVHSHLKESRPHIKELLVPHLEEHRLRGFQHHPFRNLSLCTKFEERKLLKRMPAFSGCACTARWGVAPVVSCEAPVAR